MICRRRLPCARDFRKKATVFHSRRAYTLQNYFHVAVSGTGISQDISPSFRTTTDSISYPTWQLLRGNSLIAQVETPVTRAISRKTSSRRAPGRRQTADVWTAGSWLSLRPLQCAVARWGLKTRTATHTALQRMQRPRSCRNTRIAFSPPCGARPSTGEPVAPANHGEPRPLDTGEATKVHRVGRRGGRW